MTTSRTAAKIVPTKDYPAAAGTGVTERHVKTCAQIGHATHYVDGVDNGTCPRCGTVK